MEQNRGRKILWREENGRVRRIEAQRLILLAGSAAKSAVRNGHEPFSPYEGAACTDKIKMRRGGGDETRGEERWATGRWRGEETRKREPGQLLSPGLGWLGLPRGQPRLTILISCAGPPRNETRTMLLLLLLRRLLRCVFSSPSSSEAPSNLLRGTMANDAFLSPSTEPSRDLLGELINRLTGRERESVRGRRWGAVRGNRSNDSRFIVAREIHDSVLVAQGDRLLALQMPCASFFLPEYGPK